MLILAFDTSTAQGSVAVVESTGQQPPRILSERNWRREKSHSEFLTAEIESALTEAHINVKDIHHLSVGQGPGSFTGIRVAINAARALAYALQKPVHVFETSDALVEPVSKFDLPVLAIINAQKNSYFVSEFSHKKTWTRTTDTKFLSTEEAAALLISPHLCLGDGCETLVERLDRPLRANVVRHSDISDFPLATALARLSVSPDKSSVPLVWNAVQPLYLRASGAEEKLREGPKVSDNQHVTTPKNVFRMGSPTTNTIWAVGGGKGGIGKSFISSSIAMCLSRMGKSVTLVDLDLGSANLHTCLGLKVPSESISDFLSGRAATLSQIAVTTEIPGLQFISGFNDALNVADLDRSAKDRLIHALRGLQTQYVILDLGAGTSENTLDFFLAADQKVVAVTPEPTSIENAYRFMKSAFYRRLREVEGELGLQSVIEEAMDARNQHGIKSPADLVRYVMSANPEAGHRLQAKIADFQFQLLLNQVRTHEDIEIGNSMKSVCRKYFGIDANYLGYIDHDNAVWQALRKRRPLMVEFPYSSIVGQFLRITKNLINPQSLRAVV